MSLARYVLLFPLALVILLLSPQPALAATITVSNSCSLANAIRSANTDTATGGCPAGSGDDTIIVRGRVTLSATLPQITSNMTITGGGTIDGNNTYRVLNVIGASLTLNGITVTKGKTVDQSGAGIRAAPAFQGSAPSLTLIDTTVSNNTVGGTSSSLSSGGGIGFSGANTGKLSISNSKIINNSANAYGGGIFLQTPSEATIANSVIAGNSAGHGGAIANRSNGLVKIDRSAIYNNSVTTHEGIIWHGDRLEIKNSTIYGNSSTNASANVIWSSAGNINNQAVTLIHVTIAGNTVANGIGQNTDSSFSHHVRNSLIAGSSGSDCNLTGGLTSNVGNLIEDGTCSPALSGDPQLASRASGRHYFPPQANSPLIDAAVSAHCASVDQRGRTRPQGNACDIGAIEWVPSDSPTRDSEDERSASSGSSDEESNPAPARAPVHSCQELDADQSGLSVWAQHGLYSGIQCQRRELETVHVIQAPNIDAVISAGIQDVIEIWGFTGQSWEICADNSRLGASGGLMFIEKTPRLEQVVHTAPGTVNADGETCLKLHDKQGYVVLVANAPRPASLPASAAPYRATLSLCMVQTNFILNLRAEPDGAVLRHIPFNVTLTAFHRTDGWFYVDYHGERGWLNAGHLTEIGACG